MNEQEQLHHAKKLLKIQSQMMKHFANNQHSLSPLTEMERLQCFDAHLVIEAYFDEVIT